MNDYRRHRFLRLYDHQNTIFPPTPYLYMVTYGHGRVRVGSANESFDNYGHRPLPASVDVLGIYDPRYSLASEKAYNGFPEGSASPYSWLKYSFYNSVSELYSELPSSILSYIPKNPLQDLALFYVDSNNKPIDRYSDLKFQGQAAFSTITIKETEKEPSQIINTYLSELDIAPKLPCVLPYVELVEPFLSYVPGMRVGPEVFLCRKTKQKLK